MRADWTVRRATASITLPVRRGPGVALVAMAGIALAAPARAQTDEGPLGSKYEIVLGSYFGSLNTVLRLDTAAGNRGTMVDLEQDLDAPESDDVIRGSATVRFGKHQIRAGYYEISRRARHRIDRTVVWGNRTFPVGTDVDTSFESSFPTVDYTYWLVSRPKVALGGALGVTLFGIEASLKTPGEGTRGALVDSTILVPLLGAEFRGLPAPWLLFRAAGGYIDDFSGSHVWSAAAALEPHVHKALWLGASVSAIKFSSSAEGPLSFIEGEGSYRVSGVQVYARFAF